MTSASVNRKIVIPEGMLNAACSAQSAKRIDPEGWMIVRESLEAALIWLANNPIVPNEEVISDISLEMGRVTSGAISKMLQEWQRRMFLAPEPIPESIVTYIIDPVAAAVHDKLKRWTLRKSDADFLIGRLIEEVRLATRTEP